MDNFDPDSNYDTVSKLIDDFLPYGVPERKNVDPDVAHIKRLPLT